MQLLVLLSLCRLTVGYTVTPFLDHSFGADITGLDTNKLLSLSDDERVRVVDALEEDLHKHRVLRVRGQDLDIDQHIAFSRLFGELYNQNNDVNRASNGVNPYIAIFSNQDRGGARGVGIEGYHVDGNVATVPHRITVKYCVNAIDHGDTLFTPLNEVSRVLRKSGLVDMVDFRSRVVPDNSHPLIYPHPWTGLDTMMFGLGSLSHTQYTREGVELSEEETSEIIQKIEEAIETVGVFRQQWIAGDLVIVDNLAFAHLASPGTQDPTKGLRVLRRTTVQGTSTPVRRRPLSSFPHRRNHGHTLVSLASYAAYGDPAEGTFHSMEGAGRLCRYALGPTWGLAMLNTAELQEMATELIEETHVPHWIGAREENGNVRWVTGGSDHHWSGNQTAPPQPIDEARLEAWKMALPHPWHDASGQPNDCSGPMSEPCVFIGPGGKWFDFACAPKTGEDETPGPEITWSTGVRRMYNVHPMCGRSTHAAAPKTGKAEL